MDQLVIIQNRQAVTSSLQVAENFEKEHYDVVKGIKRLKEDVGTFSEMFIEGNEPDFYGRERKIYYMNRDGFTLLAMGFTGKKALEFKLKYIEAFNQMEKQLSQPKPLTELEQLKASMRLSLVTSEDVEILKEEVNEVKSDVEQLKDSIHITSSQAKAIRKKVGEKVYESLGGKESNAFKHMKNKLFSSCWGDFKKYFDINEYRDLPKVKFEEGMKFLFMWQPSTELRLEIEHYNTQIQLQLVK